MLLTGRHSDHPRLTVALALERLSLAGGIPARCPHRAALQAYQNVVPSSSKRDNIIACCVLELVCCAVEYKTVHLSDAGRIKLNCIQSPACDGELTRFLPQQHTVSRCARALKPQPPASKTGAAGRSIAASCMSAMPPPASRYPQQKR